MGVFAGSPAGGGGASASGISAAAEAVVAASTLSAMRTALGLAIGTDVQPEDADLAAFAALTSAANKLAYFTGSGTMSLADLTAAGRALIDDADAPAMLTTLGVSAFIKTLLDDADQATARATLGAQALATALTALGALTPAANKLGYFDGASSAALADFTAAGRALVDDADAAAQLTTLGVSAYAKTLLDDADAATARATLGLSGLVSYSVLGSDFTDSGGTALDTGLTFTPAANSKYLIEVFLAFKTAATTTGMQWAFHGPTSGATRQASIERVPTTNSAEVVRLGAFDVMVPGGTVTSTGVDYLAIGQAILITGASPSGSVTIQAQTEVAASLITIYAGSLMRVTLLP